MELANDPCSNNDKTDDTRSTVLSSSKLFVDVGLPVTVSDDLVKSVHWVTGLQNSLSAFLNKNSDRLARTFVVLFYVLYFTYLGLAIWYDIALAKSLIYITCFVLFIKLYTLIRDNYSDVIEAHCCIPVGDFIDKQWDYLKW